MNRNVYYDLLKAKAREVRVAHGLDSPKVRLGDLRKIYRTYGIKVDYWNGKFKNVRGQYMSDPDEPCVMVSKSLPDEQKIFTLAHELKHHFFDQCDSAPGIDKEAVEIGAEIFAVELIFPDSDFIAWFEENGIQVGGCSAVTIVRLKQETQTTLSFASLAKRAEFLGFAPKGSLPKQGWVKLQESMYGEPAYKRFQRMRRARRTPIV